MDPRTHVEGAVAASDIENVDDLLGDLELGADETSEVIEHLSELDAAGEDAVEGVIAKTGAYDEVVSTTSVEAPAVAPVKEKKARAAKTPKEPKVAKPKIERDLSALPVETFDLGTGADASVVIACRPAQKKIGEKFDNLFQSIAANKKPSTYTMACFAALAAKGTVTQGDLVAALLASTVGVGKSKGAGYNVGTARSQAGQMMTLFNTIGLATRVKQTLTINADSPLIAKLNALA